MNEELEQALKAYADAVECAADERCEDLDVTPDMAAEAIRELFRNRESDARELRDVLRRHGFRQCDIAACNCNSWHHVDGLAARFREIEEAVGDHNGKTLLKAVQDLIDERDDLRNESTILKQACIEPIRESTKRGEQ